MADSKKARVASNCETHEQVEQEHKQCQPKFDGLPAIEKPLGQEHGIHLVGQQLLMHGGGDVVQLRMQVIWLNVQQ